MSNLVRRLPTVPRTGDPATLAWIRAAHEIIDRLQQGNGTTTQVIVSSAGSGSVSKESLGLDKVDNTSDADKPVSTATTQALKDLEKSLKSLGVNPWDVSTETPEDIFADPAEWFFISGAGTFRGKDLAVGDAALFYTDSMGDLDVIVISDVSGKEDKTNKVEDLDSPDHETYPTTQAVADALDAAQKLSPRIPRQAGRFYGNNVFGTPFSAAAIAALQRRTAFFEPLFDLTIDQIGLVVTVAPAATAKIRLAVYEMDAATPAQLNLLHTFAEISVDTTAGAKMVSGSYTFKQGRVYVFVHYSDTALNIRNVSVYAGLSIGLTAADATSPSTFFFDNSVPYAAPPSTINTASMTMAATNPTLIVMRSA